MEVNALKQFLANSSLKVSKEYVSSMLKTTSSKNILIEEWNTLIYQLKEVVSKLASVYDGFDNVSKDLDNVAAEITRVNDVHSIFEENAADEFERIGKMLDTIYNALDTKASLASGKVPQEQLPIATTTSKGIASYDSNAFVLIDGKVYVSEQYFDTYKEVYTADNITVLPTSGRADVLYLVGTELYCWNGTRYTPVKTIQSVEIAGISKGSVDNSLVFFDGTAYGAYSLVGGTNNADALGDIGDLTGVSGNLELPLTESPLSISYGVGTKTQAVAGNAIGVNSIAGIKGYYWWSVNGTTFELSTTRKSLVSSRVKPSSLDWEVGDYISVVNNNKYPFIAQITNINKVNMTVTVDTLPKVKVNGYNVAFCDVYSYSAYAGMTPEDMTIFAVKRYTNSITRNVEHVVRDGTVELGWASTAVGVMNIAAGMASFVTGYSNIAHEFGVVGGRENMCGYASIVGGSKNIDRGLYDLIAGHDNYIGPNVSNAVIAGQNNKLYAGNAVVFGYNNEIMAGSASSFVVGDGLKATVWDQVVFGRYNDYTESKNDFLVIGSGTSDNNRKNIFRITNTGEVYVSGKKLGADENASGGTYLMYEGSIEPDSGGTSGLYTNRIGNFCALDFYDDNRGFWQTIIVPVNKSCLVCVTIGGDPVGIEVEISLTGHQADNYASWRYSGEGRDGLYLRRIFML